MTATTFTSATVPKTTFAIIFAVAACHFINDIMQSLLTAIYPILKQSYGLDFVQLGLLTLTFQCTASLLQPLIGIYTDKRPLPSFKAWSHGYPFRTVRWHFHPEYELHYVASCIVTGIFLALLVEVSRVYLGVHYPTDVLAGWSLGAAWALLCAKRGL